MSVALFSSLQIIPQSPVPELPLNQIILCKTPCDTQNPKFNSVLSTFSLSADSCHNGLLCASLTPFLVLSVALGYLDFPPAPPVLISRLLCWLPLLSPTS